MSYPDIQLVTQLRPYQYNRCIDAIKENLAKQYINKIHKNIIIQDLDIYHDGMIITSLVDMYDNITVLCKITKYLQLKVDDIIEGYIDLSEDRPLFRGEHIKMYINDVVRQSDNILTSYGTKLFQNEKCTAQIRILNLCEGSHFFQGNVILLNPDATQASSQELIGEHPEQ